MKLALPSTHLSVNPFAFSRKSKSQKYFGMIFKGSGLSLVGLGAMTFLQFAFLNLRTRVLTPSDAGVFALAYTLVIFLFFFGRGFTLTLLRYASIYKGVHSQALLKDLYFRLFNLSCLALLVAGTSLYIASPTISEHFFHSRSLAPVIKILLPGIFLKSITAINVEFLKSRYKPLYDYLYNSLEYSLTIMVVLALLFLSNKLFLISLAYSIIIGFITVLSFYHLSKEAAFLFRRKIQTPKANHYHLSRFIAISVATQLLFKIREEGSIVLLALFLSSADVALFHVSIKLGILPSIILLAVNSIFPPVVGNLYGRKEIQAIKALHKKVLYVVLLVSLFMLMVYLVGATFILKLFGDFYIQAALPLIIISSSTIIKSLGGLAEPLLDMMGRPQFNLFNQAVCLTLLVLLCFWLIPHWGINGAVWAYATSNLIQTALVLSQMALIYKKETELAGLQQQTEIVGTIENK